MSWEETECDLIYIMIFCVSSLITALSYSESFQRSMLIYWLSDSIYSVSITTKMHKLFILLVLVNSCTLQCFQTVKSGSQHSNNSANVQTVETFEEFLAVHPGQDALIECEQQQSDSCWRGENFDVNLSEKFRIIPRKLLIRSINSSDVEIYVKRWKNDENFISLSVFS